MQTPGRRTHWPSTLLFVNAIGSGLLLLAGAGFFVLGGILLAVDGDLQTASTSLNLSAAMAFMACLFVPAGYYAYRRMTGKPEPSQPSLPAWRLRAAALGLALLWPASLLAGGWAIQNLNWGWLVLPAISLLAGGLPPLLLAAIGLHGLQSGPRWRSWGILGLSATIVPALMIIAETTLFTLLFSVLLLYVGMTPGMAGKMMQFFTQVGLASDEETVLRLLLPVLTNPKIVLGGMFGMAVGVPLIEEALKPLGVWLFADHIHSPREGFALGILSGAAYALFETLGNTSQAGVEWVSLSAERVGTGLLHTLTAGLTCWALVGAWRQRKYLRLAGVYILSVLLHGIWNGLSLLFGMTQIMTGLSKAPEWLGAMRQASATWLVVEAVLMLALLGLANRLAAAHPEAAPDDGAAQ